jgi:hypothetical protein
MDVGQHPPFHYQVTDASDNPTIPKLEVSPVIRAAFREVHIEVVPKVWNTPRLNISRLISWLP